jgi:hypothetical protein
MVQSLAPELTEDELQFCSNAMLVHTWPNPYKINLMQLYLWHEKIPVHPSWNMAHNIGLTNDKKYWLQVLGSWMLSNKLYPNHVRVDVFKLLQDITITGYYPITLIPFLNRLRWDYQRIKRSKRDLVPGEFGYVGWAILNYVEDKGSATYTEMATYYQTHIRGQQKEKGGSFIHHLHNLKRQDSNRKCKRYLHKSIHNGMWTVLYL